MFRRLKAQSFSEYVVLISLVSMALIGMSLYLRRGIQGALKDTADMVGSQRKGGAVIDYKNPSYNFRTGSEINETQNSTSTASNLGQGSKTSTKEKNISREGLVSDAISYEKD